MPDRKKTTKLPLGAPQELKVSESGQKKQWTEEADKLAEELAGADWHGYASWPRGESTGYFVVLHWYSKEKLWMPLYLQRGNVGTLLARLFTNKEATPICKYLSSFPRCQRKLLWVKWVLESPHEGRKNKVAFKDVLKAFSAKYNQGETLAFNIDDEQSEVPDNFSLLNC